eukprot:gb/GEZN01004630.1/.p1 GENE.gb/GEZN01004630.1/~~gb/GEZN01004630.1/.p1  ORF type:complete len:443 (+),score=32.96 gb/GEZN01004630.1/:165-1493(+)
MMIWQKLLLALVTVQTLGTRAENSASCPSPWQPNVGQACTVPSAHCEYNQFCCCPEEAAEADKMCVMVHNLDCLGGKWRHREAVPPPCITQPKFKCPSWAPPKCDEVKCPQFACADGDLLPFTPESECCPTDCIPKECMNHSDCSSGFCNKKPGACQKTGHCDLRPTLKDCKNGDPQPRPVCGCDEKTYHGFCIANSLAMNIFSFGPCEAAVADGSDSSSGIIDNSTSTEDPTSVPDLAVPNLPFVTELGPAPEDCFYRLNCDGIYCPASCGGEKSTVTCPIGRFVPAKNGGTCGVKEDSLVTIECVNNQPCEPAAGPIDCAWERYCGAENDADLFPCIGECGGGAGFRECEVRNFIPAKNGGNCKKDKNSQVIQRSCSNKDVCPQDCTFELECENKQSFKICTVKNFVAANEAGRCKLPVEVQHEGAQVLEACETKPCSSI